MKFLRPSEKARAATSEDAVRLKRAAQAVRDFETVAAGTAPRACTVCGYHGLFSAHGRPPRLDARCPACGSLERHRMILLHCQREAPFQPQHRVLHFAPEAFLTDHVRPLVARYETADLKDDPALTHPRLNIEDTGLETGAYDWILCNHVLEHVDDRRALAEFRRLLKPGGRALITVPVLEAMAETYEDPTITSPEDRLLHYGQADHLRFYGRDVRDRIRAAGFVLDEVAPTGAEIMRHALGTSNTLFFATRPAD